MSNTGECEMLPSCPGNTSRHQEVTQGLVNPGAKNGSQVTAAKRATSECYVTHLFVIL